MKRKIISKEELQDYIKPGMTRQHLMSKYKIGQESLRRLLLEYGMQNSLYEPVDDLDGEIWMEVEGSEGYLVSNLGRVKSIRFGKERILKLTYNTGGYTQVNLHGSKVGTVHRLVAVAFIPNPDDKPHINHINGVRDDNRVENLEWCTVAENNYHSRYITGTINTISLKTLNKAMETVDSNATALDLYNELIKKMKNVQGN